MEMVSDSIKHHKKSTSVRPVGYERERERSKQLLINPVAGRVLMGCPTFCTGTPTTCFSCCNTPLSSLLVVLTIRLVNIEQ